jgi:hypothetical protein
LIKVSCKNQHGIDNTIPSEDNRGVNLRDIYTEKPNSSTGCRGLTLILLGRTNQIY